MTNYALEKQLIVDVAVNIQALGLKTFKYKIPDDLLDAAKPGSPVVVDFKNRQVFGYIIADSADESGGEYEILPIKAILDSSPVPENQLELAGWIARFYGSSLADAIKLVTPPGSSMSVKETICVCANVSSNNFSDDEKALMDLLEEKSASMTELKKAHGEVIKNLLKKKVVERKYELVYKRVAGKKKSKEEVEQDKYAPPKITDTTLNEEQQKALDPIIGAIKKGSFDKFVLHGVTGSGKTEIYIKAAQEVLNNGGGVIILVPEIVLTPQLKRLFTKRFKGEIALMHSGLTALQRFRNWQDIATGKINLVVGTRMALFSPLKNCKLIVVDEEHESTYKNNRSPRYHVRDVSQKRSELDRAVLVYGSATPSLEVVDSVGEENIISLNSKYNEQQLPNITVVNMKEVEERDCLSPVLREALLGNFKSNQKSLLFLNRRGFSKFLLCRDCGHVPMCPKCAVSLTYHLDRKLLHCHHCGYFERAKSLCPKCGSHKLTYKGIGTQKVEEELKQLLPSVNIIRMDADTTVKRGAHERLLKEFEESENAILVGTQMIAKGLHFPEVALVGIVNADTALFLPDFRSAERTFQLLVQAAGRTGRGDEKGHVVLQTYNPDHYSVQSFIDGNYHDFWSTELSIRKEAQYPPSLSLVNIVISSVKPDKAKAVAQKLAQLLKGENFKAIEILGAVPAPIFKLKGRFRWHILLKFSNSDVAGAAESLAKYIDDVKITDVTVITDVNPVWLL